MGFEWKSKQIDYWNQRAAAGQGTGKVPFRNIEFFFVAHWIQGIQILDAGCGLGEVMQYLQKRNGSLNLAGFDLSDEMVIQARQSGLEVFQSDLTKINADDKQYDTCIAIRAIKNVLDLDAQRVAVKELSRISAERVIVIDSIKESLVNPPSYNLYLSRNWLIDSFLDESFNLIWEEYFKISLIEFPYFASSRESILGSDEGFYVFDRERRKGFKLQSWKLREAEYTIYSLTKTFIRKMLHKFGYKG